MNGDIYLNIDSIVLRGLNNIDRQTLVDAVQQALIEQLGADHNLTAVDLSRVRSNISLPNNCGAEQLGQLLAQSLSHIISNRDATANSGQQITQPGERNA